MRGRVWAVSRTEAVVHGMTHGGEVPDQRLGIVSGAADVARGVRRPRQGIHRRLMPLQLSHGERRVSVPTRSHEP